MLLSKLFVTARSSQE